MDDLFYTINGKEYLDEELALSILLKEGVLFCNQRDYLTNNKDEWATTIVLFVNVSDFFSWGCADGEDITLDELPALFKLWQKWGADGVIKWACIKRNEQPQSPVVKSMKKDGHWDDELEALPENGYDRICREEAEKRKQTT